MTDSESKWRPPAEENPRRICELLVGLGEVEVLGVDDAPAGPLAVHVRTRRRPSCGGCGGAVWSKGTSPVSLVDLPAFGRPVRLVWHKRRWRCPAASCAVASFTETAEEIAPARSALTARAGRWATMAVAATRDGCPMWLRSWVVTRRTVNRAVLSWGAALLAADCDRVGAVEALGLDETLFGREGAWRTRRWCTSIVDVTGGQLLDIVPGRDAEAPIGWLSGQPQWWRDGIAWGALDLSGAYRRTFEVALPHVGQVADPFHVIRLANHSVDEARRRAQNDTVGHRGRKDDPLRRARRLLISAHERLSERGDAKLRGLLTTGDPRGEVRLAQHAEETLRGLVTSTARSSPAPTSANSPRFSPTPTARRSCAAWAAPWAAGTARSPTGTAPGSPTAPPRRSTTSSNASSAPRSGSAGSPTTGSGRCSTPADPTGRYSPPSLPAENRSAANVQPLLPRVLSPPRRVRGRSLRPWAVTWPSGVVVPFNSVALGD